MIREKIETKLELAELSKEEYRSDGKELLATARPPKVPEGRKDEEKVMKRSSSLTA
jgi:hypothetical protein